MPRAKHAAACSRPCSASGRSPTAAIVGASRPEQVDANAAASGIELDESTLEAIDAALGDVVAT